MKHQMGCKMHAWSRHLSRPTTVWAILFVLLLSTSRGSTSHSHSQRLQTPATERVYRFELIRGGMKEWRKQFDSSQLHLLEKLNRCDLAHLAQLDEVVAPAYWYPNELIYSPLPRWSSWAVQHTKALIVHKPAQVFGGYEHGQLVRWGPISSGRQSLPTPSGLFHLNWKSRGRYSTVDPDWYLPWYFNFQNQRGLSFHEYALPGYPASHACIRLLKRDARWLYGWGEEWDIDARGREVLTPGTPVLILGTYDFDAPPPWRSLAWLAGGAVDLSNHLPAAQGSKSQER